MPTSHEVWLGLQEPEYKVHCINDMCTIRGACARFKTFIELTEEERKTRAVHYWQRDPKGGDPLCDEWILHPSLRGDKALRMGRHVQFDPKTKHYRRKQGRWKQPSHW